MGLKNALIIFGGVSSEHDISLLSATSVIRNIPKEKYLVHMLGITKQGQMYLYTGDYESLADDKWLSDPALLKKALISPDRSDHGIIVFEESGHSLLKIDVAFPVLHGKNGEDGTMQGLLTISGIPFVGCGSMASAICMDKAMTNSICDVVGIEQAKWKYSTKHDYEKNPSAFVDECADYLGFPCFVKPANAGSSVGINKAADRESLARDLEYAFSFDSRVVVEEGIDGREVECAVLGNDDPIAGAVGEIVPLHDFYDYEAKYVDDSTKLIIPAEISEEKADEIKELAIKAYKSWGCSGLARVDFFIRKSDGKVLLNEPNTIPGFTNISMYPMLMKEIGIGYPDLIDRLLTLAMERQDI
ncbi:MAG: D-alanine--D-alanine ligase [Clostridiales bacterium]|nr:D-alanine--D-alanine ligase [Clostridiales bacterium]